MKQGKVWGETKLLALVPGVLEFHRIEAKEGGVCSKHAHQSKTNGFYVESGKLLIREWQKRYDLVDETILGPGDYCVVPPGVYHQFEVLEDCVAFELYYSELIHDDIVRESVGFVSKKEFGEHTTDPKSAARIRGMEAQRISEPKYPK